MAKSWLVLCLASMFLGSCISISAGPGSPAVEQGFVTATLPPANTSVASVTPTAAAGTGTPTPAAPAPADCTNAAILLRDVTIPDHTQVEAGAKFTKTWEFQNTGTCPWVNYTVKFTSGDELHASPSAPMPPAAPQEKVQVSLDLTAPAADGSYAGYFTLLDPHGRSVLIGTEATFWVKFRVGAAASLPAAPGATLALPGDCIHYPDAGLAGEVAALINAARAEAGLPALTIHPEVAAFAQRHSEDMAYNNFLSHDGPQGSLGQRLAGFDQTHQGYGIYGEILAIGTAQDAMDQWRRDEHWNFVMAENTLFGVGYAYNSCSDYGGYITVDLGY